MARIRTPGDGPKCVICGKPAVWSGYCKMEDGKGYCDSQPRPASGHTPAELLADVIEDRGRLYWELVGKFVDSTVDDWKRLKPDVEAVWKVLENACTSHAYVVFKSPFEAFVVLRHTKHPNAIYRSTLGGSGILNGAFHGSKDFPWTQLAFYAFHADCEAGVLERLGKEFENAESLPEG